MSTSQKHRDFVRESMGDKEIDAIAGIGPKAKGLLAAKGYTKAFHLLGQFLILGKDEELFHGYLEADVPCLNSSHRGACYLCLKEWCDGNL